MKRTRAAVWGVVDLVLVALVGLMIWACQPADAESLFWRQCERHLGLCAKCRARGLTPARMLAQETPTRCYSFGAIPDQPSEYQSMPANSGQ